MKAQQYYIDLLENRVSYNEFNKEYKNNKELRSYINQVIKNNLDNNKEQFLKNFAENMFKFIAIGNKENDNPATIELTKIIDQRMKNKFIEGFEKDNFIVKNIMNETLSDLNFTFSNRSAVYKSISSILLAANIEVNPTSPHLLDSNLINASFLDKVVGGKEIDEFVDREILSKTANIEDFNKRLKEVKDLTKEYFKTKDGNLTKIDWSLAGKWPIKDGVPMTLCKIKNKDNKETISFEDSKGNNTTLELWNDKT